MEPEAESETIPLAWIASVAYEKLVADKVDGERARVLDLLALGISLDTPIHAEDGRGLRRIDALELAAGRFAGGASRLEFEDGRLPLLGLRVRLAELPEVMRRAVRDEKPK